MKYWWVRVFDYKNEIDEFDKGTMLDEFYLKEIETREEVKAIVKNKYSGSSQSELMFAKPKKTDGLYAILMESDEFFYNRFNIELNTFCFWHECHKPIVGKMMNFQKTTIYDEQEKSNDVFFCSYDCKRKFHDAQYCSEGEWQSKQEEESGNVIGYIYHIYNKVENVHYIGQTRFLPFFRWQEHVKSGQKGAVTDLVFDVITEVKKDLKKERSLNQQLLNSAEAWWIAKFQEDGFNTINISHPRITIAEMKQRFNEMVSRVKQEALAL